MKEVTDFEEFNDDLIKSVVEKGRRTIPNPDFEDRVMRKIQDESAYRKQVSSQLKASLQFFVGALIAGVGLTLVVLFDQVFEQYEIKTIAILCLFAIGLIGVLNIDNYRRLIKKYAW